MGRQKSISQNTCQRERFLLCFNGVLFCLGGWGWGVYICICMYIYVFFMSLFYVLLACLVEGTSSCYWRVHTVVPSSDRAGSPVSFSTGKLGYTARTPGCPFGKGSWGVFGQYFTEVWKPPGVTVPRRHDRLIERCAGGGHLPAYIKSFLFARRWPC